MRRNGQFMQHTRSSKYRNPSRLIALADGVYAGKQSSNRLGYQDCRVGFRHTKKANTLFADGHVEPIPGDRFPRAAGSAGSITVTTTMAREDNYGDHPTIYSNVDKAFTP